MNRAAVLAFAVLGIIGWSAAEAKPLTFGIVNGADDFSNRAELGACRADAGRDGGSRCALARASFGGLPVARATLALNPARKPRSLDIVLDAQDYDLAYQLLVGRYGPPTSTRDGPRWSDFDAGASLAIRRSGANATISFDFPENAGAASRQPDTALVVSLLLFAGLGLAAGALFYAARAKRRTPSELSMRATLERRVSEGSLQL